MFMYLYMYILYIYIYPEVHITRCEEVDGGDGLESRGRRVVVGSLRNPGLVI